MTHIEVTTTVAITDSIGRHIVTVTNTARADDAPNPRYFATFTRGAIQSTEHHIAAALIAQFGEHPEAEDARERLRTVRAEAMRRGLLDARPEAARGTNDVAPWTEGLDVRLTEGDYAGRIGRIYKTMLDNSPPMVTVELAPPGRPDDPSEPIVLDATTSQIELY